MKSGSLMLDIQRYGSCRVIPCAVSVKGTFFAAGGRLATGVNWECLLFLQREEKSAEEGSLGNKEVKDRRVFFVDVLESRRRAAMETVVATSTRAAAKGWQY